MVGKRITEPGFSDRPAYGRAFRIAMGVVGGIALAQFVAIGHGLLKRRPAVAPAVVSPAPPQSPTAVAQTAPPPVVREVASPPPAPLPETPMPAPSVAAPSVADAVVDDPPSTLVAKANEADPRFLGPAEGTAAGDGDGKEPPVLFASLESAAKSQALADPILERLMTTGVELRASGNTQGALRNFREVEAALPDHPRILSEIAATMGLLGLKDKETGYWERVEALGPAGAGPYFAFALAWLGKAKPAPPAASGGVVAPGVVAPGVGSKAPEAARQDGAMKIGEVKVAEEAPTGEGQKVSLSVVVDAAPGTEPSGEELSLLVYFYDRVAGGEVRPSTADTSYLYPTEPYDWKVNGTETIVVNYLQPVFTEEQRRELGERTFHGYAIELYYRDELQDKVAMPEDVAALRFDPAAAPGEASEVKPENALFPNSVVP
jgi:hypothetical protein